MNPVYMLDTNICIYLMKRQPRGVFERFERCYVGDVVMSAVTLAELEYGVAASGASRDHNRAALDALVEDIPPVPYDVAAARAYGDVRLASRERRRDALDKLIASHAIALGVTLVTNDAGDFGQYLGLKTENWIDPQA